MDAGDAELGVGREAARREAGQALDIVADEQGREGRVHAAGGDDDRQRAQDRLLPLERPAQLAFGLELLAADLEVLDEQPALLGALATDLLGLAIEVDEDVDLRLQDQRLDRLEDVVDGAGRVAAKDVQVVLVVGGQEQDRDARRARPRPDHGRELEAVDPRHADVEQDDRELVLEDVAQHLLAGLGEDDLEPGLAQHLLDGEEVARIVVGDEHLRGHRGGSKAGRGRRYRVGRSRRAHMRGHQACPTASMPAPFGRRPCPFVIGCSLRSSCTRSTARSWSTSTGFDT